ncbi:hypothetical protein [Trichormus azollae]|jgi:Uma2 family endonuclease|uniref:Uncharacterized protein n=1 Tax=Nostoc azollae (strain 0708) TaxID=551115 RepID=D7E4F0_NOSA0|nr:hypothetical protein [Trichormus azollae]ADI63708.1 conserved hypothetical protein ['Nostoc azollae' 0708]
MLLELQQIIVELCQQMLLKNINWQQLENILEEMVEKCAPRIYYSDDRLKFMVSLPEHEKYKELIGDLIKLVLDKLEIDFEPFGSTRLKNERMRQENAWLWCRRLGF